MSNQRPYPPGNPREHNPTSIREDGVVEVYLPCGRRALIDAEDLPKVHLYRWCAIKNRRTYYAKTTIPGGTVLKMHRLLAGEDGKDVDHRNGDGLDNRKRNLRSATRRQNLHNSAKHSDNALFKGVTRVKDGRWRARIGADWHQRSLGTFPTAEAAARAYDAAAVRLHGEFARLNFPQEAA